LYDASTHSISGGQIVARCVVCYLGNYGVTGHMVCVVCSELGKILLNIDPKI